MYLHIAEGAPGLHPDGTNIVGKMLAYIVSDFIKVKLEILKRNWYKFKFKIWDNMITIFK